MFEISLFHLNILLVLGIALFGGTLGGTILSKNSSSPRLISQKIIELQKKAESLEWKLKE